MNSRAMLITASAVVFLSALLMPAALAQGNAYYNITKVESEQLSNAVRITIKADGKISYSLNYESLYDWELLDRGENSWLKIFTPADRVELRLFNARSKIGSFCHVGKYPVSHVEFSIPPKTSNRFELVAGIRVYKPVRWINWDWQGWATDLGVSPWFEIEQSPDQRSIIITFGSDRRPKVSQRLKPEGIPEDQREMQVKLSDGKLDVHARNVPLTDLISAVSRESGEKILVDPSTERLVTAELSDIAVTDFITGISECYGLALDGTPGCWVLSDTSAGTAASYIAGSTEEIPVKWLKADRARDLLPDLLLDYIRVDQDRNTLVVSGPASLIAKIKADIARLDVPGPLIEVKAVSVECSSTADLVRELGLTVSGGTSETGFDLSEGELVYTSVGVLPEDFEVRLNALEESSKGKTNATSSISMLSGETGEIFAGTVKLVQLQVYSYSPEEQLEPISAGVKLNVTTWTGGGPITLAVKSEVSDIARDGARLPTINTRIAEGMLRLDPGETMMIGGLTERQVYKSVRKIPILGDLPIIGGLFRSKRRHVVETRLAVFLTPSILTQFASSERTISRSNMKPGVGM